jgi:hypothetical protein
VMMVVMLLGTLIYFRSAAGDKQVPR